jgi:hypothetical protein
LGVQVIDISTLTRLGSILTGSDESEAHSIMISSNLAYVSAGGMQVIAVNNSALQNISSFMPDSAGTVQGIAISGTRAYVADGDAGLQVLTGIANMSPVRAGAVADLGTALGVAYCSRDSVQYAFVAEEAGGGDIINATVLSNDMPVVGLVSATGSTSGLVITGDYSYWACGKAGMLIADITDPTDPQEVVSVAKGGSVMDIAIDGNYAYLANIDLQVFDVTYPTQPVTKGSAYTGGSASGVAVAGGYAYVTDESGGLSVINVSNPDNPRVVGNLPTTGTASDVVIDGIYAYLADGMNGVHVIDVSDPSRPKRVAGNSAFDAYGLTIASNRLFVATRAPRWAVIPMLKQIQFKPPFSIVTNSFQFFISGTVGETVIVQTNLSPLPTGWGTWRQFTLTTNQPVKLIDTDFLRQPQRYYRARFP